MSTKPAPLTLPQLKKELSRFATKSDLKPFATKEDLKQFATKEELKQFATKADLKSFATKEDLKQFATKTDLLKLKSHIDSQLEQVVDIIISGVNGMNENHLKEYHTFGSSVSN